MKNLFLIALMGMLFIGSPSFVYAQGEDSVEVAIEVPTDTISIDNMEPVFYEEESEGETCNTLPYAIGGGVIVVAAGLLFFLRKKKK